MTDFYERSLGCMYGMAIGDALGMPVEFMDRDSFDWVTDYQDGIVPAGSWTDDTSMALCLAQSLIDCDGHDPKDQLEKYLAWYESGYMSVNGKCFDIGNATKRALENFRQTGIPESPFNEEFNSGNGSLMRLAPVPIFYHNHGKEKVIEMCALSSITTHNTVHTRKACEYLGLLLHEILSGVPKKDLTIHQNIKSKCRRDVNSGGYVWDTYNAACWAFWKTSNFRDCIIQAVNLGDDADTVGAVAGMLAGAYYQVTGIPDEWKRDLKNLGVIREISISLYSSAIKH